MSTSPKRRTRVKGAPGIYRSMSGKYELAYRDSDGRLRFKTVDGDLESAKAARAEVVAKKARGERVAPSRLTLCEYASETYFPALRLRPRTITIYRNSFRLYIDPTLGTKRIAAITVDDVAKLIAKLEKQGLSGWTIRGSLTVLGRIFATAERASVVQRNPVRQLDQGERPKVSDQEQRILTTAELQTLLSKAGDFRALVAVGAFAGLRLGEALGLRWDNVDTKNGFLHVRNQLDHDRSLVELKTNRSRRDVVMIPQLASALRAHRMKSRFKRPTDFVFPAPDGRGRDRRSSSRGIERAVERAKVGPPSFHGLRHTYASMLIGTGADVERVSRQLGHANSAITLSVYSHVFDAARTADELRTAFSGSVGHLLDASS